MIVKILKKSNQKGFTIIEVLMAIVITGVIAPALVMSISQVVKGSGINNNRLTAINNVRAAGDWISQDARNAASVSTTPNSITLTWQDYDGTSHTVIYLMANEKLTRDKDSAVTTVAQSISSFTPSFNGTNKLNLDITTTVGSGAQQVSESRTYEVRLRNAP